MNEIIIESLGENFEFIEKEEHFPNLKLGRERLTELQSQGYGCHLEKLPQTQHGKPCILKYFIPIEN
jgi:hypothetical protein